MTFLVVGLGNPGSKYDLTRHNIGIEAVLDIVSPNKLTKDKKSGLEIFSTKLAQNHITYARTTSYMNTSGEQVGMFMRYNQLNPEQLIVIHDDLDLEFNQIKLKLGGGEGGHNGLKSITAHLKTKDYYRIRLGLSRPASRIDPADYVLSRFNTSEQKQLPDIYDQTLKALNLLINDGLVYAQNNIH